MGNLDQNIAKFKVTIYILNSVLSTMLILFQLNYFMPIKVDASTINDSFNFNYNFKGINNSWSVSADYFSYDRKNNSYKLTGNVTILNKETDVRIKTDSVYINDKDMIIETKENTSIIIGGDYIVCQNLIFSLENETGTIYNASVFFKKNNLFITGNKIEKISKNRYIVDEGLLTTCINKNNAWSISGKEIKIEKGKYGSLKNAILRIKQVPIIYLPYFIFPTLKRQSGLLSPRIKYTNKTLFYCQPIFLKINDTSDITFYPGYISNKGWSVGSEYRMKDNKIKGLLLFDWEKNKINCEKYSYWLRSKISKELPMNFIAKIGIDLMKNITELENNIIKESKEKFRSFMNEDLSSHDNFSKNYLIINKAGSNFVFNTVLSWDWNTNFIQNIIFENRLRPTNKVTLVQFDSILSQLADWPIYSNIKINLTDKSEYSIFKANIEPKIYVPILVKDFISMNFRLTSKCNDNFQKRFYNHNLRLNLFSEFSKKYNMVKGNQNSFKHSIEVQATYEYNYKTDNFDYLDKQDFVYYKNLFSYSVTNYLLMKHKDKNKYRELFYLNLQHIFKKDNTKKLNSNIEGELYFSPNNNLVLQLSAYFVPHENCFSMCSSEIYAKNNNNSYFSFSYFNRKNETELLKASIQTPIGECITASIACGYDRIKKNNEFMGCLALYYDAQCWSAGVKYEKDLNEEHGSISISIELLGFGSNDKQKRVRNILSNFNKDYE